MTGGFGPKGLAGYLENSDSGGREESGRAMERCFFRGQPRPRIEVILTLIFSSKILF